MGVEHIRDMTLDDIHQVLHIEATRQYYPWPRIAFEQALRLKQRCRVYVLHDSIMGYSVADGGHGRLVNAVSKFVAGSLYTDLLTWISSSGIQEMWAEIDPRNYQARKVLENMGFKKIGVRPNFYGLGNEAHVYSKNTRETTDMQGSATISVGA